MSQFYDEFANDAEREQKQCLYKYWKEFETGKPLSYRERKREEYELSQGRLITVAYKGVMMHIDFETDLEKENAWLRERVSTLRQQVSTVVDKELGV